MAPDDEHRQADREINERQTRLVFRDITIPRKRGNGSATATIDATETYFVTRNVINQTNITINAATGIRPKRTPTEVATPFPPLKPSHTG